MSNEPNGQNAMGVGIIGCGVISGAYLRAAQLFPQFDVKAVADIDASAATARGAEFAVEAKSVEALLADPAVDIVLNLTIPVAHAEVGHAAISAGKHVYGEKPLAIDHREGKALIEAARAKGLRVGCAPDTFLGGSHQCARQAIDEGRIGKPFAGTAFLMLAGHERWHPNPDFYYVREGGGPMFDMGPYYLTDLVNLLGPIERVAAFGTTARRARTIGKGPREGQEVPVHCTTHIAGTLQFVEGAVVQIATSFEVWKHGHYPIEIYGTEGSLKVADPNRFDGFIEYCPPEGVWEELVKTHGYGDDNYRSIGLADMVAAIREGRPHRASGDLSLHVLEVMEALVQSAEDNGVAMSIESRCPRPAPLQPGLAVGEIA